MDKTDFAKAVYSPCQLCAEDPTRAPLWQLKAVRVTHDQVAHRIEYHDAWLEIYGVPVAYTPYFSHPDPTVKRQSGVLTPTFTLSKSNLGATTTVPYYFVLGPNADATFQPMFTTQQGIVLGGEYRRRLQTGEVSGTGSITRADRETANNRTEHNVVRGNIDALARFDIDDTWRWGANLDRASDKTYLRLYGFGSDSTLTSQLFTEAFDERSYGLGRTLWFQGTRKSDNNDEFPLITPELSYNYVGEPDALGSFLTGDVGALNLARIDGRDVRRISGEVGWILPQVSRIGTVTTLSATMQADGYWVNSARSDGDSSDSTTTGSNGFTGRLFPQLAAQLSYPFARYGENFTQVLEPMTALVIAPPDPNTQSIPNEDSQDFVFDETNLFRPDRSTGIDRADGGQRLDYGLQWSGYGSSGGTANVFLGQSYRFNHSREFANAGGIKDQLSDYVGRLGLSPFPELDLGYRFQLDHQTLTPHRNELQLMAGNPDLNVRISYVFLDHQAETGEFDIRQELDGRLRGKLSDNWSGLLFAKRDLEEDKFLTYGVGLFYENECIVIGTELRRDQFQDREVKPATKLLLRVTFKTLGGVGGSL